MDEKNNVHEDIYRIIGLNIRLFRKKNRLGLDGLAEKAGISGSFLSNIERGTRKPTLYTIERLAFALGIGVTALLSLKEKNASLPEDSRLVFETMKLVTSKTHDEKRKILNILKQL
jgi:transcriptional regulator with XRE-family HTH domain